MPNGSLNLDMAVESPENVQLTYQVAGPAVRCLAYGLDSLVRGILLILILCVALWSSEYLPGVTWGIVLVILFGLEWGYYVISEGLFRGKTIGKDALGLRVVGLEGDPVTFWSAMQRNLMRAVDSVPLLAFLALASREPLLGATLAWDFGELRPILLMIPVYGPALCAMVLTERFQRLGDLVAGTVVISERRSRLTREPVILLKIEPLSRKEIGPRVPEESTLALIDDFLSRRDELTYERGHQLCTDFALALASYLDFQGDRYQLRDYPMSFLARVYVTFAKTDSDRPTAGAWPAPKHEAFGPASSDWEGARL